MISKKIQTTFYKLLLKKTSFPVLTILGVGLLYIAFMAFIDHRELPIPHMILALAIVKTLVISYSTSRQLSNLILNCHSIERFFWVFAVLIGISIISFATDYTCLYQFEPMTFDGLGVYPQGYIFNLFDFFYFSVITFSTVGYGDIVPVSNVARLVVMLEIFLSYFIIIFSLANIKKIHLIE